MEKIIFWGATGQAKMLREVLPKTFHIIAMFDNNEDVQAPFSDIPLYYKKEGFYQWKKTIDSKEKIFFVVAIGGAKGKDRVELSNFLEEEGFIPYSVIAPGVQVSPSVKLGKGVQILTGNIIGTETEIGDYTILAPGNLIGHESKIGKGVHICGGATVGSCLTVEDYATFYVGAMTVPRIKIGEGSIIGIGSVVIKSVPAYTKVFGNPALKIPI